MRAATKLLVTALVSALAWPLPAAAQVTGGSVVFGGATIALPNASTTLIKQSTNAAIINWQSFSLASGASVVFDQPNAAAIVLNRVLGGGSSVIDGNLQANGQVWLINSNGILFGKNSQINVAGLLATTSDITDNDFAAGRYDASLPSANAGASVDNAGTIHIANGGAAILSGQHVSNSGLIEATGGQIILSGANAFTIDFDGDNLLRYAVTAPVTTTPTDANGAARGEIVANSGTLNAVGGRILLTARAAANVANNVINNTGMISATSATIRNGEVILDAGDGTVDAGGSIDASGEAAGQTGGTIALAGNTVKVADNATLDASGDQGGGSISIGGGLHGAGTYQAAQTTSVGNATIRADATSSGNGGTVSIWSSGHTSFAATVTARGGVLSGDGGLVETSGHTLNVGPTARVATSAANGANGEWLLDPTFLEIVASDSGDPPLVGGTLPYTSGQSQIMASTIEAALAGGTNVTLQAVDDITVSAAVNGSGTGRTLELDAGRSIILNADLDMSGSGGTLILSAKNPGATGVDPGLATISGAGVISADFISLKLPSDGTGGESIGSAGAFINIGAGKVSLSSKGANIYIQGTDADTGLLLGNSDLLTGRLIATSPGDLTIAAGAAIGGSAAGDSVILSAAGHFINNAGAFALQLHGGRFLIYSASPTGDVFGGLNSGNTAIWNTTYPTAITAAGSRYVFAQQPTLTFTSTDLAKTYGDDVTAALPAAFTVSGFQPAVAGAYLGDSAANVYSGAPTLASAGAAAGAAVAGSPYVISISQGTLTALNGYAFSFASTGEISITAAVLSVSADPQTKVYGATDPALSYTASGFVNNESAAILTGSLDRAAGENVGNYAIDLGSLSAGSNYTIDFTGANFAITPATLTVVADPQSKVYGTSDPALSFVATGFQFSDTADGVLTGALSRTAGENVGNYAILQGSLVANANYTIDFTGANFAITAATLSIVADPQSKVYGASDPALSYVASGFANDDTADSVLSGTLSRAAGENVGNYAILQGSLVANSNYTIDFTGANFAITPATLAVVADPQTKVYGASDPTLSYVATGFQFSDTADGVLTGALSRAAGENVGNYAILPGSLVANSNYTIDFTGANFAITQATLSVVADPQTKVYGTADPTLTFVATGFQFSDNANSVLSGSLARAAGANVGNYAINQGSLTANGNYAIAFTGAIFAITPATLTYVANTASRTYGAADPALSGSVTGFAAGDTLANATTGVLSFTSTATALSNVGNYAINGSGLTANHGNYVFVQAAGNATALSVTPATLTYVADPASREVGTPNPAFTGTVVGFVNGENLATATTGVLSFTSAATIATVPGSYAINGSGLSANHGNYVFAQAPGNGTALTVTAAEGPGLPPGHGSFLSWLFGRGGDRPTDEGSVLFGFTNADGVTGDFLVQTGPGGSTLPSADGVTGNGPIAELTFGGNSNLEPLTSADRLSGSLSHYFQNGSLFDGDYSSWGNEALWY